MSSGEMNEATSATPTTAYQPVPGTYGTSSSYSSPSSYAVTDKPLFGESTPRDRILNLIVGAFTAVIVTITLISAFCEPRPPHAINIYFAVCILLILASHLVLIYWYRQGDVDPKFRNLIYYNAFTIILLCICAMIFIFHHE